MRCALLLVAGALALAGCESGTPAAGPTPTAPMPTTPTRAASASRPAPALHLQVETLPWRLPEPLAREALSSDGGSRVTVAGGMVTGDASTAAAYVLHLTTGRVTRLPSLAVPVHDTAAGATAAPRWSSAEPRPTS